MNNAGEETVWFRLTPSSRKLDIPVAKSCEKKKK